MSGIGQDRSGWEPSEAGELGGRVRPYAITGGRTRSAGIDLPVEALLQRTEQGERALPGARMERRRILELTSEPLSVAEVSARVGVHLGVARVLVGDLAAEELLVVHQPPAVGATNQLDLALLERVLDGLRAL